MTSGNGIHLFGASGSGVSTLGFHLSRSLGIPYLDTDDFYWEKTNPPFTTKVPPEQRLRNILALIDDLDDWVLGGSLCGWGDPLIHRFDLAVFVYLPAEVRLENLRERELTRHGERILAGGDMYEQHKAFMDWASRYDSAGLEMRSLETHRRWARQLRCPVLELRGPSPVEAWLGEVLAALD